MTTKGHHAIERARQRYGLQLTTADVRAIEAACASARSVVVERFKNGAVKHLLLVRQVAVFAVIGPCGRCFTILPRDAQRPTRRYRRRR